jgi:acyl-CoA synthetase (AMP-forming)/AMP-acid ligase II
VECTPRCAGLEFVKAMWGCLFAGVVAVPVCPPDPTRLPATLPHFNRIVEDCGAVAILTDRSFHMVCVQLAEPLFTDPPAVLHAAAAAGSLNKVAWHSAACRRAWQSCVAATGQA